MGTRAEVKNISGFKTIHQVIAHEIERQSEILDEGGQIEQETRAFDVESGTTISMRDKEVKQDYRFMPEPNLPPLQLYDDETIHSVTNSGQAINIDDLKRALPILPAEMRKTMIEKYDLSFEESLFIVNREMESFFFDVLTIAPQLSTSKLFEWIRIHVIGYLYEHNLESFQDFPLTAKHMVELLVLEHNLEINHSTAVDAFNEAIKAGKSPVQIVEEMNRKMISDVDVITNFCKSAIESLEETDIFARYEPGNPSGKKNKKIIKK